MAIDLLPCCLPMCSAFSPLSGFMDEATYDHVVEHSRLPVRCFHHLVGQPATEADARVHTVPATQLTGRDAGVLLDVQ
jgi:ATP sulfurylase